MTAEPPFALVIGAGPAGLMAADRLLRAGHRVVVAESKPSPARKFLMAGKSGLNLTKHEPFDTFVSAYAEAAPWLHPALRAFGPDQVEEWARSLGQHLFIGSSERVFPRTMKASPLLRAWLADMTRRGLDLRPRWRWVGLQDGHFAFDTPLGSRSLSPAATVLALGGASWPRLGSTGDWASILAAHGVELAPFKPANMGFMVAWSAHMTPHFGAPLKSIALIAGSQRIRGEAVITERGLEGGGVYSVSRALREGALLSIDLFPDHTESELVARLARQSRRETSTNALRKALGLTGARLALFMECARPIPGDAAARARLLKSLPIPLSGPQPLCEAISTAGGIARSATDPSFMLRALPGVFAAGEMLDWEAPTGGYLLTACLATGRAAGQGAAHWLAADPGQNQPKAARIPPIE